MKMDLLRRLNHLRPKNKAERRLGTLQRNNTMNDDKIHVFELPSLGDEQTKRIIGQHGNVDNTQMDSLTRLADGNPGAATVLRQLLSNYGIEDAVALGELGIRGPNIWILYKDCCHEVISDLHDLIQSGNAASTLRAAPRGFEPFGN